jgi:hypothetical protein
VEHFAHVLGEAVKEAVGSFLLVCPALVTIALPLTPSATGALLVASLIPIIFRRGSSVGRGVCGGVSGCGGCNSGSGGGSNACLLLLLLQHQLLLEHLQQLIIER